jgi:hypothetical protein
MEVRREATRGAVAGNVLAPESRVNCYIGPRRRASVPAQLHLLASSPARLRPVKPTVAIVELEKLQDEAAQPLSLRPAQPFASWKARVQSIMGRSLGQQHHITKAFNEVRYTLTFYTDSTPDSAWDKAFVRGMQAALGYIDAAIYELGLLTSGDEPVDQRAYDAELWDHVRGLVEAEEWAKVASQTAIFVEDRVRSWTGHIKDRNGNDLHGKDLFAAVLRDESEYRLGRTRSEIEGWRALGIGFVQALGNVDRHRIQARQDVRRYALGVLGVGSLLLTQLRHENGDHLHENESIPDPRSP